jgi:hypothetical protein
MCGLGERVVVANSLVNHHRTDIHLPIEHNPESGNFQQQKK